MSDPRFHIDIENAAGDKLGAGPITSALNFRITSRLDRAGEFAFTMPYPDLRGDLATQQRIVRCWQLVGGVRTEIANGRINSRRVVVGDVPSLQISGEDLLGELGGRSVGFLELSDAISVNPTAVQEVLGGGTDLPLAYDGNAATYETITLQGGEYLYLGSETPLTAFDFVGNGGVYNTNAGVMAGQGFSGSGWATLTGLTDGTANAGKAFGQNGPVSFDPVTDEQRVTHEGLLLFWYRFYISLNTTAFRIAEITVAGKGPLMDDIAEIMTFAPAGWTLNTTDFYQSTVNGTYQRFAGESVLGALVKTAKATGEHFRLGTGREVEWLQNDQPTATVRAIRGSVDPVRMEENNDVCLITNLEVVEDGLSLITRIYPFGSGNGDSRLTLANTTETAPAGYTLDAVDNYIEADAPTIAYGRIEVYFSFKEIGVIDDDAAGRTAAANQLFTAALTELQRRSVPSNFYRLSVTKLNRVLRPGELIRVSYRHHTPTTAENAQLVIEDDLLVLEVTTVIDSNGIRVTDLMVTDAGRWPVSDGDIIADQFDQGGVYEAHNQPVDYNTLKNKPPSSRSVGWAVTNLTGSKSLDVSTATLAQLREVVGSIIQESISIGNFGG